MVLLVATLTVLVFGVIEVTIVAPPTVLSVSTFAGFVFRVEPPIGLVVAAPTPLHVVAFGVAHVACGAGPVVFSIVALAAVFVFGDIPLAVFAMPVVLSVSALGAVLVRSNLKIAVSAKPTHQLKICYFYQFYCNKSYKDNFESVFIGQFLNLTQNLIFLMTIRHRYCLCHQYMYCRIKSRRLPIDHPIQEPLIFCNFINEQRLFLLFKNGQFIIADPTINPEKRIIYQDALQTKQIIVDCKRVKTNVCALLSKNIEFITFVRYVSDQQAIVGGIQANQMELLRHLQTKSQLIVFNKSQFLIHSQSFQYKSSYFTIFTETKHQFNYDIKSKSYLYPHNFQSLIVKALPATAQMACFKQKDLQDQRKIMLIRLSHQFQNEQLDVSQLLTEQDQIADIIAKSENQYGLFIVKHQLTGEFKIAIYNCRVNNVYGKYSTNFHLSQSISTDEPPFMNIIEVSPLNHYYLVKKYAHITQNGQIYDNFLQLHSLQTYQLIDKVPCSLKTIDVSPSKLCLIDYSQQIESSDKIVLHIRNIFTKKYLYAFLLQSSQYTQNLSVKKIHQNIIQLL